MSYDFYTRLSLDADILGMDYGKAMQQLIKLITFDLCCKLNKNTCYRCNNKIETAEELAFEHIKPWSLGKDYNEKILLLTDYNNIKFSHATCNSAFSNAYTGSSRYVGVCRHKDKAKGYEIWKATARVDKKLHYFGYYENEIDAAEARDLGVLKYLNGIGLLNFPEKIDEYKKRIEAGWDKPRKMRKCKICGDKHFGLGYCKKHHYWNAGGREKRLKRYNSGNG